MRRARAFAGLLLWCTLAWAAPPAAEHHIKAVYLFNFGQFVEWPGQAFESADAPLVIGVLGDDPVGDTLEAVVRGESLQGRPLEVRRFASPGGIGPCHILFVGRGESSRLDATLAAIRGRSVLSVTDIDGAEHRGAVIVLFNESNRIRMRINVAAAKAANLVISSKLLRPAEIVGAGGQ
jgi:hypothetical protein